MNCAEVPRFVHVDIDRELDPEDRVALEGHLNGCSACAEIARQERDFVGRLRGTLRAERVVAPPGLSMRIDRALDDVGRSAPSRPWMAWGVAVAAAAVILVSALKVGTRSENDAPIRGLVGEAIARHQRELPIEVSGSDPTRVGSWFRGKLDVPVRPPALRPSNAQLLGGRLSHLGEHQAAYLVYDVGGSKFSVFIFDPRNVDTTQLSLRRIRGRDVYVGGVRGYSVAIVNEGGLAYAFTSDMDEKRMLDVIPSVFPP